LSAGSGDVTGTINFNITVKLADAERFYEARILYKLKIYYCIECTYFPSQTTFIHDHVFFLCLHGEKHPVGPFYVLNSNASSSNERYLRASCISRKTLSSSG